MVSRLWAGIISAFSELYESGAPRGGSRVIDFGSLEIRGYELCCLRFSNRKRGRVVENNVEIGESSSARTLSSAREMRANRHKRD